MGVKGLLHGLNSVLVSTNHSSSKKTTKNQTHHISQFHNQSLAIDTSSWLFKASYSCAERLVEAHECHADRPDPVAERILCKYILTRCHELLTNAFLQKLYLVFDGRRCPMKERTNHQRHQRRCHHLQEARHSKARGNYKEAEEQYQHCIQVMSWMKTSVSRAVRDTFPTNKVQCIVSPYEADAQLASLCLQGLTHAVVTEDSDILLYSASCHVSFPIIYKLNRNTGSCNVITMNWLLHTAPHSSEESVYCPIHRTLMEPPGSGSTIKGKKSKTKTRFPGSVLLTSLRAMATQEAQQPGFGARMFIQACILSGCDYAPSCLTNVGLMGSFQLIREHAHQEALTRFHKLLTMSKHKIDLHRLTEDTTTHSQPLVMHDYEVLLAQCEVVFYHHYVCHASTGEVTHLTMPKYQYHTQELPNTWDSLPCTEQFDHELSFLGDNVFVAEPIMEPESDTENVSHVQNQNTIAHAFRKQELQATRAAKPIQNTHNHKENCSDRLMESIVSAITSKPDSSKSFISKTDSSKSFISKPNSNHLTQNSLNPFFQYTHPTTNDSTQNMELDFPKLHAIPSDSDISEKETSLSMLSRNHSPNPLRSLRSKYFAATNDTVTSPIDIDDSDEEQCLVSPSQSQSFTIASNTLVQKNAHDKDTYTSNQHKSQDVTSSIDIDDSDEEHCTRNHQSHTFTIASNTLVQKDVHDKENDPSNRHKSEDCPSSIDIEDIDEEQCTGKRQSQPFAITPNTLVLKNVHNKENDTSKRQKTPFWKTLNKAKIQHTRKFPHVTVSPRIKLPNTRMHKNRKRKQGIEVFFKQLIRQK